ncbi:MAG TPA: DEAD/DEAH box helicase, partial [Acidimicrobiales bacterium]|nr:DEAD/DEAH box helicase [Acidimicrobiales bacterium]
MTTGRHRGTARDAGGGAGEGFRERFERGLGFPLDGFQHRALDAIDGGESVLVSAPTGSGKTVIADYAAARALELGGKAFYTTPIKALSNQKFAELSKRYGEDRVGLLTGDVSYQARAPIVVMTTEVLRNMLFARSSMLDGLEVVVLDEVHYLQDPYRGSVWEEVLVLTPPQVRFVSLSATVSNARDFGAWLTSV